AGDGQGGGRPAAERHLRPGPQRRRFPYPEGPGRAPIRPEQHPVARRNLRQDHERPAREPGARLPARAAPRRLRGHPTVNDRPAAPAAPDLPPLRDVIARHGLAAPRALGQHFLLDLNLTRRTPRAAAARSSATTIERGRGPGGLTRALLECGARQVTAIERDERCRAALAELEAAFPGRLTTIFADALVEDASRLGAPPRRIVANLPYNVATPLLI